MNCCQTLGEISSVVEAHLTRNEKSDFGQIYAASRVCATCGQPTMDGRLTVYEAGGQIVFYLPAWKMENLRNATGRKTFREQILGPVLQVAPFANWHDRRWETFSFDFELVKQSKWVKIWQQEQQSRARSPEALADLDWAALAAQVQAVAGSDPQAASLQEISLTCLAIALAKEVRQRKEKKWPDPAQVEQTIPAILQNLQEADAHYLCQPESTTLTEVVQNLAIYFTREVRRLYVAHKMPNSDDINEMFSELCRVKLLHILDNARRLSSLDTPAARALRAELIGGKIKTSLYQYYYAIPLRVALCSNLMIENFIKNWRDKESHRPGTLSLNQPLGSENSEQDHALEDLLADPQAQAELEAVLEAEGSLASPPGQLNASQLTYFLQIAGPWLAQIIQAILHLEGQRRTVLLARMRMSGFSRDFFTLLERDFGLAGLTAALPTGPVPANPLSLELLLNCTGANQVYNQALKLLDQSLAEATPQVKRTFEALKDVLALRTENQVAAEAPGVSTPTAV